MLTKNGLGRGDVAQLGERRTCTAEAVGSNPIISIREEGIATKKHRRHKEIFCGFCASFVADLLSAFRRTCSSSEAFEVFDN